jgi:hypothetical protein
MNMRALAGAFCLAIVAASQLAAPAQAGPLGPRFCAQIRGGGENCGYYTFNQCLASISGVGGYCYIAPIQTQAVDVLTRRGLVRVYRDAID